MVPYGGASRRYLGTGTHVANKPELPSSLPQRLSVRVKPKWRLCHRENALSAENPSRSATWVRRFCCLGGGFRQARHARHPRVTKTSLRSAQDAGAPSGDRHQDAAPPFRRCSGPTAAYRARASGPCPRASCPAARSSASRYWRAYRAMTGSADGSCPARSSAPQTIPLKSASKSTMRPNTATCPDRLAGGECMNRTRRGFHAGPSNSRKMRNR